MTKAFKIYTFTTIAENFENNFKEGLDYQMNEESMGRLLQVKKKYTDTIACLGNLERIVIENGKSLKDYKSGTLNLLSGIQETYKWLNPSQEESSFGLEEGDPYPKLNNWILDQEMDLSAVIEAISKVEELLKVQEITRNSISTSNLELQKLAVGKKSLAAILNNKSKEDMMRAKQNLIDQLTAQSKAIDIIIPVVSSKLLNTEIPNIETNNLTSFDKEIRTFSKETVKEFEGVKRQLVITS